MERGSYRYGFTLVELSIVLVIIGLLVSGIMAGKSLIEAGEVRQVVTGINELETAINLFVYTYDYLPGDFPNAADYWPGQTSNGNGDHKLPTTDVPTNGEGGYLFHHLGLAKMYRQFQRPNSSATVQIYGATTPELFSGTGMVAAYRDASHAHNRYDIAKPYLQLATHAAGSDDYASPAVKPATAQSIDKKIDDGKASSGRVVGYHWTASTCTTYASDGDYQQPYGSTDYNLTYQSVACRMAFFIFPKEFDNR